MPFEKGRKKTGGRKKGSTNKTTSTVKEKITLLVEDLYKDILKDLENLSPEDRLQFFVKLLPYVVTKAERIELTGAEGEPIIKLIRFKDKQK